MKIINVEELKNLNCIAPFYSIFDLSKKNENDPRACSCASLALLNAILVLKTRLRIEDCKTAFDELVNIREITKEKNNLVQPEDMLAFIEKHPIFDSCRILVMSPNAMNEEVFLRIFLRRLAEGNLVLVMMEVPEQEDENSKSILNHASFVHSENGEVFFDSLRVDLNFLIRAFYFSKLTTLLFLGVNPGGSDV